MKAREPFEKRFKRLYFHVKPLGQNDLQNWSRYLDYELIHGNVVAVIVSPHAQDSITVLSFPARSTRSSGCATPSGR